MKTLEEHIKSINVNKANFQHIAETGRINGTLLQELRRVMTAYANEQAKEFARAKLQEAAERALDAVELYPSEQEKLRESITNTPIE